MENQTKVRVLSHDEIDHYILHAKSIRSETMIGHFGQLSNKLHWVMEQINNKVHGLFHGKSGLKKV